MSPAAGRHAANTAGSGDEALVLGEINRLLDQLHLRPGRRLTLDSDLTTDLGVDSLALIELFDHLESTFGVTLDDDVLMSASTPRHWLDAVRAARGDVVFAPDPSTQQLIQPAKQPWPDDAVTLLDAVAWHVERHPARSAFASSGSATTRRTATSRTRSSTATRGSWPTPCSAAAWAAVSASR